MIDRKRLAFSVVFGAILVAATLAGIEALASFYVPPWPARAVYPRIPSLTPRTLSVPFERQPWLADLDNSWGMRDVERSIAKPPGTLRAVFVGDSFVVSPFTPLSLPAAVERRLSGDRNRIEAINLGVSATDPRSYYFRIRDFAIELQPDAVLLFIYAANDFMSPDDGYTVWPRLIDESPGGSLLGLLMPRTNWLVVNRLNLSEFFRNRSKTPLDDEAILYASITAPPNERLQRVVDYAKTYHYPDVPRERIFEILSRGNGRFYSIAYPNEGEQEYLLDWNLQQILSWETNDYEVVTNGQDAVRLNGTRQVDATLSWIEAIDRVLRKRGVPLLVFLVPTGSVDPDYVEFWRPWPRAYSWNIICDEWHKRLATALPTVGIRSVDLRDVLTGIAGAYRKLDGHWSQKGEAIVAARVARELESTWRGSAAATPKKASSPPIQ